MIYKKKQLINYTSSKLKLFAFQKTVKKMKRHKISKTARYEMNIQKSVTLLFAPSYMKEEFQKTIPLTTASKTMKYLDIN